MNTNTIEVTLTGTEQAVVAPEIRWNQDIVQFLKINGITLPAQYQVDFANVGDAETITMIGDENGVQIPDQLISTGIPICAYLYLQTGDTSWNTQVKILINVIDRPDRSDIQPTPSEQSTIDSLISAMNNIVREGVGIPAGGTAGQVLTKQSDADYDAEWEDGGSGGGNVVVVNFTYNSSPYSLTADKTYAEVKDVLDAGGFAVAIVNHGYSMYELSSVSDVQITFTKNTFTDGTNSGVKITRDTFSLLAAGGCGSIGSEKTYGGNYPVWNLILAVTDDGYAVQDYDITRLGTIIGKKNADFQVWVYPSTIDYYNNSEYEVYRLQKAAQWYDGDTQLDMTAGEFVNITDGKVKKIRIEMEEYGDWGNADYIYTETAL